MTEPKEKSDYPDLYQWRQANLWRDDGSYNDEGVKVSGQQISFFVPKSHGQKYDIDGRVKSIPEVNFDKKVPTSWVMERIADTLFTKKKTKCVDGKSRRRTLRKDVEKLKQYQVYDLSALTNYATQAHREGCEYMILSWQEIRLLEMGKFE